MNRQKTVLITGASSGIGRELAKIFASHHYNLVLIARSRVALETLATELHEKFLVNVRVEICDLSNRDELESLVNRLIQGNQVADVLVNNAGFGVEGPFSGTDWETELSMLDLNMIALTRLTKVFLPQMVSRRSGRILQIASMAAYQPGPFLALYFASKAFVLSFSEAISKELQGSGVTVTTVCPGLTQTGFQKRLGGESELFSRGLPVASAEEVAVFAFKALMAGKRTAVPGILNRCLSWIARVSPRFLTLAIIARVTGRSSRSRTIQTKDLTAL